MDSTAQIFMDYSARKLRQLAGRIEECLRRLSEEQIWARGSANENAVGNLVLHLEGNVRQWIISAVGVRADTRRRDEEFAARGGVTAAELGAALKNTVEEAVAVLGALPAQRLMEQIRVQDYDGTVLEAVYHVVEHFSGHTGQIIFATKLMRGEDLGFYRHLSAGAPHTEQTP